MNYNPTTLLNKVSLKLKMTSVDSAVPFYLWKLLLAHKLTFGKTREGCHFGKVPHQHLIGKVTGSKQPGLQTLHNLLSKLFDTCLPGYSHKLPAWLQIEYRRSDKKLQRGRQLHHHLLLFPYLLSLRFGKYSKKICSETELIRVQWKGHPHTILENIN